MGKFIEAFEYMVDETRRVSIRILQRDEEHGKLVEVLFHHDSMSAKPLFDIMRALIAEWIKQPFLKVEESDRDIFSGVLKEIATHYVSLANTRNMLLHGTWEIGAYRLDDPEFRTFALRKFKLTKAGLTKEDGLPKNAEELLKLADSCGKVRWWLGYVGHCLPPTREKSLISKMFVFKDGKWRHTRGGLVFETLS